jgi:hypothetical protein
VLLANSLNSMVSIVEKHGYIVGSIMYLIYIYISTNFLFIISLLHLGVGVGELSLPARATIANMSPEYGATMGFFPVDQVALDYLKLTGRSDETVCFAMCRLLFYHTCSIILYIFINKANLYILH